MAGAIDGCARRAGCSQRGESRAGRRQPPQRQEVGQSQGRAQIMQKMSRGGATKHAVAGSDDAGLPARRCASGLLSVRWITRIDVAMCGPPLADKKGTLSGVEREHVCWEVGCVCVCQRLSLASHTKGCGIANNSSVSRADRTNERALRGPRRPTASCMCAVVGRVWLRHATCVCGVRVCVCVWCVWCVRARAPTVTSAQKCSLQQVVCPPPVHNALSSCRVPFEQKKGARLAAADMPRV